MVSVQYLLACTKTTITRCRQNSNLPWEILQNIFDSHMYIYGGGSFAKILRYVWLRYSSISRKGDLLQNAQKKLIQISKNIYGRRSLAKYFWLRYPKISMEGDPLQNAQMIFLIQISKNIYGGRAVAKCSKNIWLRYTTIFRYPTKFLIQISENIYGGRAVERNCQCQCESQASGVEIWLWAHRGAAQSPHIHFSWLFSLLNRKIIKRNLKKKTVYGLKGGRRVTSH